MANNNKIVNQLRVLVLLTKTEEQVARTRISQARTDAVRRELTQNADNAAARTIEITEALRGPAALVATPVQKVAGGVARAVNAPVRFWASTVNGTVETVRNAGEETSDRFSAVTDRAAQ